MRLSLYFRRFALAALAGAGVLPAAAVHSFAEVALYKDKNAPVEKRVNDLLRRMTLEEKLDELSGKDFMDGKTNARLGIPPFLMTDGPHGIKDTFGPATCFPVPVTLASSWDEALAERFGAALARETRGKGRNVILGPCVNIHRSPLGGRNFESFGEDPYLSGRMAVAYVRGVEAWKVASSVKHFAANNQEHGRFDTSSEADERTLREIYFPAFKTAVQEAAPSTVMAAYNLINGVECCEDRRLLTDVLKKEWGFKGLVMSDWWALNSGKTAETANAGLDLEMPGPGKVLSREALAAELRQGKVSGQTIDEAVRRSLRVKFSLGWFDGAEKSFPGAVNTPEHRALAREAAENGIVLLKNNKAVLPLKRGALTSIAVIGPNAAKARAGGGGSSTVSPAYLVSPLEGITKACGDGISVQFAQGCLIEGDIDPVPQSALRTPEGEPGLKGEYFANMHFNGSPAFVRTDPNVDFDWGGGFPRQGFPADEFSVRWTGRLTAPRTGAYDFTLMSDDGSRMYVNDKLLVDNWGDHSAVSKKGMIQLEAGKSCDIRIEYYEKGGGASAKLGWSMPGDDLITEAASAAEQSDVAIVFAGLNAHYEGEDRDRADLFLPGSQDELIEAVSAANPNTVVVLINGTPVDMRRWADKVPAILEAWYPGAEGGNALAAVLFGDVNPSGKLPCTLPKRLEDNPSFLNFPGSNKKVFYKEGIFVGYRHYDRNHVEPLFPFGHGLSYTTFKYTNLTVTPGQTKNGKCTVRLDVTNTGPVEGREVVQLYVGDRESSLPRPPKELKAFKKVSLKPGETTAVEFTLSKEALSFFDPAKKKWIAEPGEFEILAGSSSRDIRAKGTLLLK